jgi:sensor c-di-GMP phosphodiesterase-like protein
LAIEVVAEGIESVSQHSFLLQEGCQYGQGFLYSKAVPNQRVRHFREMAADAFSDRFHKTDVRRPRARAA